MYWTDAWKLGASMWANGVALSETALAATNVVGHRSRTINTALNNPLATDFAELGRMVPEKLTAFGKAGQSLAHDWTAIQSDMLAQGYDMASLMLGGWPPSNATMQRIANRGSRVALQLSTAGGRALAPVHSAATANDRRLKKAA